jgi:methyl-accepting chemotaxis protein
VEDAKARGSFDYLAITDHHGIVEASTDGRLVGRNLSQPPGRTLLYHSAAMTIFSATLRDGRSAFLFDTPILFQNTPIGTIQLGVDQAGTERVLGETLSLLTLLGLLAVIAVGGISYFFGILIARPMRLLLDSLAGFGEGDGDRRISQKRSDEFGELFAAFNRMAESIQQRFATVAGVPAAEPFLVDRIPESVHAAPGDQAATLVMSA